MFSILYLKYRQEIFVKMSIITRLNVIIKHFTVNF